MPTYDYFCTECDHKMEVFHKITDAALTTCTKCRQETLVRKPGGGIGLSFSGDGFYATMYGNPPSPKGEGGCCPCGKDKPSCSSS